MTPLNTPDLSNLTAEQKRELLTQLMQRKAEKAADKPGERSQPVVQGTEHTHTTNTAPLSFAQQRLWFIDQLQPGQTVYTIPAALRLQGRLQAGVLQRCLNTIVARHEILRTQFVTAEGAPLQNILPSLEIELPVTEQAKEDSHCVLQPPESLVSEPSTQLRNSHRNKLLSNEQSGQRALSVVEGRFNSTLSICASLNEFVSQPFNLQTGPLLRCQLLKLNDSDHILAVTIHHIIADYWSLKVLMKEIAVLYSAFSNHQPSPLSALPIQYGDYAAWQHAQHAPQAESQLNYWLQQLAEPPTVLQLPTDHPRPAVQSFSGARHSFTLSHKLSAALAQLAQQSQATLFMTLLAAFQVLLYRYSGQSDILVGSTVSNRDRAETKDLIGLFANSLVFRANITPEQPFEQFLQQVKATALAAFSHQDVPFEQVVDALKIERQLSHNALFQVMFILHNTPKATFTLPDLTVTALEFNNSASRFDLSLDMYESETGLTGVFEYSTDLFEASTLDRLVGHFETLLTGLVAHPKTPVGLLPLLTSTELSALQDQNQTAVEIPDRCAHELIEAQAEQTPDAIALSTDHILTDNVSSQFCLAERPWTYQQLSQRANQLAHYLSTQGVAKNSRIALALNRSAELVVAMLAILKLGGTYIPLDPTHPAARLQHVLKDAEVSLILESDKSLTSLIAQPDCPIIDLQSHSQSIAQQPTENLSASVSPDDLAYIIYTSGSTGKPKGVPIRHRSLVNLLISMAKAPGMTAKDAFLAVTTVAFDIATLELLLPLTVGARLAIASAETVRDGDRLVAQLKSDNITIMQATPATWRLMLDMGWEGSQNLKILCGGEALDLPLAEQLLPRCQSLWNLYGPTETTIWSGALQLEGSLLSAGFVPIGNPIDNTEFHILDAQQQPVPIGIPGELHIGGAGLSPGYLNQKGLADERFIPNPLVEATFSSPPTKLYKTGDLIRSHANGSLEYLGRLDHQVKLRGFRIELGDIEAALNNHPDIDQSLVVLRYEAGEPQLVAYCKVWPGVKIADGSTAIHQSLNQQLPAYMVPAAYVLLTDFPLTPNGKIDRKALPEPQVTLPGTTAAALQTETEQRLADIWADILPVSTVRPTDNFFEIGGHSLLAARVITRIQPVFGVAVPLRSLFETPTLITFAATIDAALRSHPFEPIRAISREQPLPLSFAQQRQWVLAQLEPDSSFYNIPAALRLEDDCSLPLLKESMALICQRHEGLRSVFESVDGKAALEILQTVTPQVAYTDARDLSEQQVKDRLIAEARKPFDLNTAPLMRAQVIRTDEQVYIVSLVLHHIIADAESVRLLMREIISVYSQLQARKDAVLPPLPIQYVDYAAWQQTIDTTAQLSYWQRQLANVPPLLSLPTDYPRPATQQFEGGCYRFTLAPDHSKALKQLSQTHNATLFITLMAAFQVLLHRYSDAADLVVGTPVSHRPEASLEGVLGMFVNTLVLRGDFSQETSFDKLIEQIRATALDAYANQDVPFEQVIDALNIPRNWSHSPLFQVMFVWQAAKSEAIAPIKNLRWSPVPLDSTTTKVDLTLSMAEEGTGVNGYLSGKFEYRQDLFHPGTIEAMADAFCTLLEAVVKAPTQLVSRLPLVSKKQHRQLQQWNKTNRDYSTDLCLHQLFEQQVGRSPQAQALITPTETLSYQELNSRAHQLAHQLHTLGIGPESRVGICLDRSAHLIVAIFATLKAGAAYVPLDPSYPTDRLTYILEDAQISIVLTQQAYQEMAISVAHTILLDTQDATITDTILTEISPVSKAQPHNLAYIIYTSGSTGKPKGVAIEHRSPVTLVQWATEVFSSEQLAGVLAATSVCFDLSIFEIFVPLSSGGSVILADDILQLPTLPAADRVSLINTVPTAIAALARINGIPDSVSTINLAGEAIPPTLVKQLYALGSVEQVFNLYGPSEDTTYSTYTALSPDDAVVPIGVPIANTQAYVLDEQRIPVPIGMPGELYLSGDGLARGYWNQADMTSERFIDNLYKTGDHARYRPDGQLEFLGRADDQVKVRGFRIELGEIESTLLQCPQVVQAVVTVFEEAQNRRLVAHIVLTEISDSEDFGKVLPQSSETLKALRSHLQKSLPDYMLPAAFVPLEALPLLPNGKVNHKALPDPVFADIPAESNSALTSTERTLVEVWRSLLNQSVSVHDNFFELGGDSILAIQAIAQAQKSGLYFSPRDLFQHPTVAQLATISTSSGSALAQQSPILGAVPLTPIQHWFFAQNLKHPHHWNQSVLLTVKEALDTDVLEQALRQLMHHHDALRAVFRPTQKGWVQSYSDLSDIVPLKIVRASVEDAASRITAEAEAAQTSFSLQDGPLWQVIYYDLNTAAAPERRLFIVCHHLLVDGVSWRILLSDLQMLYQQLSQPTVQTTQLPPKTLSCQYWGNQLTTLDFTAEQPYWENITMTELPPIPQDFATGNNVMATTETISVALTKAETTKLLKEIPAVYSARIDDMLLTGLLLALEPWAGSSLRFSLEGHGRPEDQDFSRTVGWLTTLYPVLLQRPSTPDLSAAIKAVKETLRAVPGQRLGYGVLNYLQPEGLNRTLIADTPIRFNYLGQTDQLFAEDSWLAPATESTGAARSPADERDVLLEINAMISQGKLTVHWTYSRELHKTETINHLANVYLTQLSALIEHCLSAETDRGYSPTDFPQMGLAQGELDEILASLGGES